LLKGLNAAGGAIANDVMNKAEKLTSIQDRIDERQAQLASDKIKLARTDNEKDRNEFARRIEKREGGLQSLTLARAQIQGGIENTLLNVASRERLGGMQLEASRLDRDTAAKDRILLGAQDLASKQIRDDPKLAHMSAAEKETLIKDLTLQYYNNAMALRGSKGATTPPSMKEQARKILEEKGIKS
jgi:hypothetical protein